MLADTKAIPSSADASLLEVQGLTVAFATRRGRLRVVHDVEFEMRAGETLGLVGESGSGKTTTLRSIIRLLPQTAIIEHGAVMFEGISVLDLAREDLRRLRASAIGTVFQDPYSTLNPVARVGQQLTEALRLNLRLDRQKAESRAVEALDHAGIPEPEKRMRSYPHELSGGMRQRVMFAIATAAQPRLLLADEPTTALDVTTQAQILALLGRLREETGMATVLVSHDFGVIAQICDTVAVMYAGYLLERAPVRDIYQHPHHPYTQGLLKSIPSIVPPSTEDDARLNTITGQPPDLGNLPKGCPFQSRCPYARSSCQEVTMVLEPVAHEHFTACPFIRSWDVS